MSAKTRIVSYEEAVNDPVFNTYVHKVKKQPLLDFLEKNSCIATIKGSQVLFNRFTFLGNPRIVYYNIEGKNNDFVVKFLSDLYLKNYRHFFQASFNEWIKWPGSKMIYMDNTPYRKYFKYDFD